MYDCVKNGIFSFKGFVRRRRDTLHLCVLILRISFFFFLLFVSARERESLAMASERHAASGKVDAIKQTSRYTVLPAAPLICFDSLPSSFCVLYIYYYTFFVPRFTLFSTSSSSSSRVSSSTACNIMRAHSNRFSLSVSLVHSHFFVSSPSSQTCRFFFFSADLFTSHLFELSQCIEWWLPSIQNFCKIPTVTVRFDVNIHAIIFM